MLSYSKKACFRDPNGFVNDMSTYIIIIINLFFVDFEILQCQKN